MSNATATIRFFYNGIKVDGYNDGKLQKGSWSFIEEWTNAAGRVIPNQLTLYGKNYRSFQGVHDIFAVENDSDSMTDYFENDRIRILPGHSLFKEAAAAYVKQWRKWNKKAARNDEQAAELEAKVKEFIAKWID